MWVLGQCDNVSMPACVRVCLFECACVRVCLFECACVRVFIVSCSPTYKCILLKLQCFKCVAIQYTHGTWQLHMYVATWILRTWFWPSYLARIFFKSSWIWAGQISNKRLLNLLKHDSSLWTTIYPHGVFVMSLTKDYVLQCPKCPRSEGYEQQKCIL